jgi:phage baseplate assembly protein V
MDIFAEISALKGQIHALVQYGVICATKADGGKALARVDIAGRQSDWLPVMMLGNSVARIWIPPMLGEQVVVLSPYGDPSSGVVLPSIFSKQHREPAGAGAANLIVEFGESRLEMRKFDMTLKAPSGITLDTPTVQTNGDIVCAGNISDVRGDLTAHIHTTTDGATAKER